MVSIPHNVKLGRLAPRFDARTLRAARYLVPAALPPLPSYVRWSHRARDPWGMMLNDRIGDCTCASAGHAIQTWTANQGQEVTLADADILAAYSAISGYDPTTGANDNGAVELDVLNYWRTTGIGGRKIGAYVALEPRDQREIKEGIYLFGGVYIGVALPLAWQNQSVWKAPHFHIDFGHAAWRPGSWGGHAVYVVDYDAEYATCVSWGELIKIQWVAFPLYVEEAYGIISPEWVTDATKAPNGFDMTSLIADLNALGQP